MKSTKLLSLALGVALSTVFIAVTASSLSAGPTDGVAGCWRTISDKDGKVKSRVCMWVNKKGQMVGQIKKIYNPDPKSKKNEKGQVICSKCKGWQKNKPIEGLIILWGLKKGGDAWEGGKIMDPNNGKIYTAKMWREGSKLKVRGYIGFFYRTQTWVK